MTKGFGSHASDGWWQRWPRGLLLLLGMSGLVTGLWGGLLRIGLQLPLPVSHANWITYHGPLMVCAFLGTLIGLERAVGLGKAWTFLAPLMTGLGGLLVEAGAVGIGPRGWVLAGSLVFGAVTIRIVWMQPNWANGLQMLGAMAWVVGNVGWLGGSAIPQVVPCWMAFLLLTIVGERLELSRFQRLVRGAGKMLAAAVVLLGLGLVMATVHPRSGGVLMGLAMAALAAWLSCFDLAWRTIRAAGLPRFMGLCLLVGYGWLLLSGIWIASVWPQTSGPAYDGVLHAFFVGFVFSMIFGHAPVILPSVLALPVVFHRALYGPLLLLHATLALRLWADVAGWAAARGWGAAGNGLAVLAFLMTLGALWVRGAPGRRVDRGGGRERTTARDAVGPGSAP